MIHTRYVEKYVYLYSNLKHIFMSRKDFLFCLAVFFALPLSLMAVETPTMGWSSWNTYRTNISDSLIMRQADAMVARGLKDVGYLYVNTDDGFFGGRNMQTGELYIHPRRFPHGLKPVVDHIHALGLKAGIYSDAGSNTCGNYYDNDTLAENVGLYRFEDHDAQFFFKQLGYDFIKIDDCGFRSHKNYQRRGMDTEERFRCIHDAMVRAGATGVRLNVCRKGYPGKWVYDVASSWRISKDIHPKWSSVKKIIGLNLYLSAYARHGCYNDMDMLEVGRGMSDEEDQTHFGMWCIMASPLLIGCDMTTMSPKTLALLKNTDLIALDQDTLGLQAQVVKHDWADSTYVLAKDLVRRHGTTRAVALYNPSDTPRVIKVAMGDLLLSGRMTVRDLIGHKNLKEPKGGWTELVETVPAHGARFYRIEAEQRTEQTRYEAETAFLSAFQQLYNPIGVGTAYYEADSLCSGGMKVRNLGLTPKNDIVWDDVYSERGGDYEISLKTLPTGQCKFYASVNDGPGIAVSVNPDKTVDTFRATLKPGTNVIRFYDDQKLMPDVDYMEVVK